MGRVQMGSGVGTAVGPRDDVGPIGIAGVISPSTDAGQALIVAAIGLAILMLTVARGESGIVGKVGRSVEMVVVVFAAMVVANYAARTYAGMNPDGPLAAGVRFDA